jgi:uncharacterized protein YdbL (DUF1318 family)
MVRQARILAAAFAAAAVAAIPAVAGPALDQARASCQIGETISGYLGAVPGASPSAQALAEMEETNNGRRAVYMATARENGVDLNDVARLTGERQVQKAAGAGECFQDDGGWKQ